jgi:glycosyltransferase involved in cell wall biosynthesis
MKNSRDKALVSVIIPTRNEEDALDKLLKSLSRQTYKNYEVIVVDGGSTDGTVDVAKKHGAKVIKEYGRYRSPANARNIGVEKARGDIIAVFDCDSEVNEIFLEEGVKAFSSEKIIGVRCSYILAEDTIIEKILASKIAAHGKMIHGTAFTQKGLVKRMGGWDASLGYGEDRDLAKHITDYNDRHKKQLIKNAPKAVIKTHLPHTISELVSQQRWYGRTIMHYLKKSERTLEYLTLLKVLYMPIPIVILLWLFGINFWLPLAVVSLPVIALSLLRTTIALIKGRIWGLCLVPIDIFMSFPFAYGLIESIFRKGRGRD